MRSQGAGGKGLPESVAQARNPFGLRFNFGVDLTLWQGKIQKNVKHTQ